MRDHERAHLRADELLHAARDDPERVDVEAGVGLVEHRHPRLQHRHLQDLDALLLAAGEPVVEVARRELAADLEAVHLREQLVAELGNRHRVLDAAVPRLAHGVDRAAQEARHRHARDRMRVLEREEQAALRALVRRHLGHVLAVEEDPALGDLVGRVAHDRVGERALPGAVRPHDGVHLVQADLEVDPLDDLAFRPPGRRGGSRASAVPLSQSFARKLRAFAQHKRSSKSSGGSSFEGFAEPGGSTDLRDAGLNASALAVRSKRATLICMPGWISPWELLLLALVVLLVFGPKRLPEMGRSLGKGMREFKDRDHR